MSLARRPAGSTRAPSRHRAPTRRFMFANRSPLSALVSLANLQGYVSGSRLMCLSRLERAKFTPDPAHPQLLE